MLRNFKVLLAVLVVLIIAGGAYAFANANGAMNSSAGYKANAVSGYDISHLVYNLNTTNANVIDSITFTATPQEGGVAASVAKLQTATSGAWKDCTLVAGTDSAMNVTCTYGALDVTDVTDLNIVVTSSYIPAQ